MSVAEDLKNDAPEQTAAKLRDTTRRARREETLRDDYDIKRKLDAERRPPVVFPEPVTLRQLLAEPDAPTPWRITDCQPSNSRVMLAAQFKAGKTTLVGNLVRSLLDGQPFLGKYAVEPVEGTIAVLDFEMGRSQLKRWYRDQQIAADDRVVVYTLRGCAGAFNLADLDVRARWVARLRADGARI